MIKRLAVMMFLLSCLALPSLFGPVGCDDKKESSGTGSTLAKVFIDAVASSQYISGTRTLRLPKNDTTTISIYELTVRGEDGSGNPVSLVSGYNFQWNYSGNVNITMDTADANFNGNDRQVRMKAIGDLEDNGSVIPTGTLTVTVTPQAGGPGITSDAPQTINLVAIRKIEFTWTFMISGTGPSTKIALQNGTLVDFEWGSGFVSVSNTVINGNQVSWTAAGVNYTGTMAADGMSMSGTHDGVAPQTWSATR